MREGPLAALFRKTDEEGIEGERRPPEAEPKKLDEQKPRTGRPFPAADSRKVKEHAQELRPAPPSARVEAEPERRPARSPEERLRDVFAADIPENMLERSPAPTRTHDEYRGRYGREEPKVSAVPAQILQHLRGEKSVAESWPARGITQFTVFAWKGTASL